MYGRRLVLMIVSGMLVLGWPLWADRGSIPFKPHVKIFEPTQRAMIAWDGKEEILLLSTDLRASEPTKVLEVIPLPAEPKVEKGDVEVFKKAVALINQKLPRLVRAGRSRGTKDGGAKERPAGEITFHKKIGAHDIAVTHVLKPEKFVSWVKTYLKKAGVDNPEIPAPLQEVIKEYLKEKFTWFVFDVVELGKKTQTNDAIQYRFKSESLYYPMKITRTEQGKTTVELLVLTPKLLKEFPGIPIEEVKLPHPPVTLTAAELRGLNKDMAALLKDHQTLKLRIWRVTGTLSEFKKDLVAK